MGNPSCPTASLHSRRSSAPSPSSALFLLALLLFPFLLAAQTADQAVVQAILFYSPTCPHCHQVINEVLLPLQEEHGEQLQIIGIDTSQEVGSALYGKAVEHFKVPQERLGVPTLIVSNIVLVGGLEIPSRFPQIIEEGLLAGGIAWPEIPDLSLFIPDLPPPAHPVDHSPVSVPAAASTSETAPTVVAPAQELEEVNKEVDFTESAESAAPPADPAGFALAWLVLIGMIAALVYVARQLIISPTFGHKRAQALLLLSADTNPAAPRFAAWAVPLLALLGLGVALYLAYVEITHVEAVCGPVGECNIVQSSPYAQLFGIPIAVLGALSYLAIIILWAGQQFLPARTASLSSQALVLTAGFGTLFSIYLTLLELFAIKAICLWCLSSAVLMTLILILSVKNISGESLQMNLAAQTEN